MAFWTLSFELPQFHGHGSWLVCEVALSGRKATHPITILALDNLTTSSNGIRVKASGLSHPFTSNDKQC
jgi:hypothetical protein